MGAFSSFHIAAIAGLALITGCSGPDDSPQDYGPASSNAVQPLSVESGQAAALDNGASDSVALASGNAVTLIREGDGHFYVEANVNGAPVRMMVDTGATSVALTMEDAEALGISQSEEGFSQTGRGVGGDVAVMPISIDNLSVGAISHRDVPAVVVNSELQVSLLGQSWLSRVGNVSIQGDKMTLN